VLPPVRGGLAQRLRQAEVNEVGIVQVHSVLPPAIVGVHKPDPVRQLAQDNRRVMSAFRYELKGGHNFDSARSCTEI